MQPTNVAESHYIPKTGEADKERLDLQAQLATIPLREALSRWVDRLDLDSILHLLDFGCGVGSSVKELKKQFPKASYIGLDRSKEQVEVAKKAHSNVQFFIGDETDEKGQDEIRKADLVFMQFVAMHQTDLKTFFSNIVTNLKPGAELMIFDPYSDDRNIRTENSPEVVETQKARFKLNRQMDDSEGLVYNAAEHYSKLLNSLGMVQIDEYRKENMCFYLRDIRKILVSNLENAQEDDLFRPFISVEEVKRHIKTLKEADDNTVLYLGDTRILIAKKPTKDSI